MEQAAGAFVLSIIFVGCSYDTTREPREPFFLRKIAKYHRMGLGLLGLATFANTTVCLSTMLLAVYSKRYL